VRRRLAERLVDAGGDLGLVSTVIGSAPASSPTRGQIDATVCVGEMKVIARARGERLRVTVMRPRVLLSYPVVPDSSALELRITSTGFAGIVKSE